jgi:hypothetical protein
MVLSEAQTEAKTPHAPILGLPSVRFSNCPQLFSKNFLFTELRQEREKYPFCLFRTRWGGCGGWGGDKRCFFYLLGAVDGRKKNCIIEIFLYLKKELESEEKTFYGVL